MKNLVAMTLGAAALACAMPVSAQVQSISMKPATMKSPPSCSNSEPQEVSLYFELDRAELNDFSKTLVDRVANEAKNCGLTQVVAETRVDPKRAEVISDTFQARGMRVVLLTPAMSAPTGDDVANRSAKLRLTMAERIG